MDAGKQLADLTSERASVRAETDSDRGPAGSLRGGTIGLVGRGRAAVGDELQANRVEQLVHRLFQRCPVSTLQVTEECHLGSVPGPCRNGGKAGDDITSDRQQTEPLLEGLGQPYQVLLHHLVRLPGPDDDDGRGRSSTYVDSPKLMKRTFGIDVQPINCAVDAPP